MRSLKYYSEDLYVKKLKEIDFPDYSNFKDINEAYSDFTGKVASVIDEIAPIKEVQVKSNSQDWFDAEINEEIERQDKLLAKFKSPDPTAVMKTIKSHEIKSKKRRPLRSSAHLLYKENYTNKIEHSQICQNEIFKILQ